jgi:hypothetical protein
MNFVEREERERITAQLGIIEALCTLLEPVEIPALQPTPRLIVLDPVSIARDALVRAA